MKSGKQHSPDRSTLTTNVEAGGETYTITTERIGTSGLVISSKTYLGEKLLFTNRTEYTGLGHTKEEASAIKAMVRKQHENVISALKARKGEEARPPSDYIKAAKAHLRAKDYKKALVVLSRAKEQHPEDPFVLSFYGCMMAIVGRDHKTGIAACKEALTQLKRWIPFGYDFFYPALYLNLGRAYVSAGRKKEAVEAFNKGLKWDPGYADLQWEMSKLGKRKRPSLPVLERSNPLNKYIGMLLHRISRY